MKHFRAGRRSDLQSPAEELQTRANRVRQHERWFAGDVAAPRMRELADELDAQATAVETGPVATRWAGWARAG
jgi:hypothetical protein